ncbi:MAG: 3-oxoacid CoA-transferase subunit B [Isosphaeraceae bacterium]
MSTLTNERAEGKELIARRVAREVVPGTLVNLGIGLPTLVAAFVPPGSGVFFQTENGLAGVGPRPPKGLENPNLVDAGGGFITAIPGAASFDSAFSFGLIRGGHLDLTVLGGLQVDSRGRLANWMISGKIVPGMGGAMDLVTGARRVIVAMIHTAKGSPRIVEECEYPLTSIRPVDLVVTDLAVIEPTPEGLLLRERAPGVAVEEIQASTAARLIIPEAVPEMALD